MTHYQVSPSHLRGRISPPPSKSQTLRAILFASLANGNSTIHNFLDSPDTWAMINACTSFGAQISAYDKCLHIVGTNSTISPSQNFIDAGNSGIVLRFCSAIAALSPHSTTITGDASIQTLRPMQPLLSGLKQLGASVTSLKNNGFAPVEIKGTIKSGHATISGEDSQPVSALLMASAFAKGPITLDVENPGEKPWIGMTLSWFDRLGISYHNNSFRSYRVEGNAHYEGFNYTVPADMSSAAFPLAAALITNSELCIDGIDMDDPQGDKELVEILQKMGANLDVNRHSIQVKKGKKLHGISVDINNCVDTLPILATVACFAEGETHIVGAAITRQKECNRIFVIASQLQKMGGNVTETSDGLMIRPSSLYGSDLSSFHDHRVAMALTVAALGAHGKSTIGPIECIAKTYPTFLNDFCLIGANIQGVYECDHLRDADVRQNNNRTDACKEHAAIIH